VELSQQLEGLSDQQGQILKQMEEWSEVQKTDADRFTEAKGKIDELAGVMAKLTEERATAERESEIVKNTEAIEALKEQMSRSPSKAKAVAGQPRSRDNAGDLFFWSVWASRQRDPILATEGKALLDASGSDYAGVPAWSKATLGDTATAGGNVIPPAVLEGIIEIATAINPYRQLLTVVDAGFVTGVSIPSEGLAPVRATVQAYGATKTNINLTTNLYTATMYTLAAIYDIGNQLLRNSRGAAEQLVRNRLTRAQALGEAYYVLQGSGSSEPKGILTSIGTSGTFVTSFTAVATTLAGSSAAGIAKATGALANRSRQPDGVVVNTSDFWIMASQGTDTAGFWFNPAGGPTQINPTDGMIRVWGLPVYADPNMPSDSMVVGEWKSAQLYTGQQWRIDVSDQAGTRWDTNETGFRGEEEIGFNADPYVSSGMFQRITDFTP
jgi:HK97 family phage major capsid protein